VDPHHFDVDPDADAYSTYHPAADSDSDIFLCGSGFLFDAGPNLDSTFHSDQDPNPTLQIMAQTYEKCSNRLIFHRFWLVICKLLQIRIQLITSMQIRILIFYLMRTVKRPKFDILFGENIFFLQNLFR
jgi:hypothetical protein